MNAPGATAWPLTLYYDHGCPLCRAEMFALKAIDAADRLRLVDCSAAGFADADATQAGVTVAAMMRRMHARNAAGRWHVGVPAFVVAYGAVGVAGLASALATPRLQPLFARVYGWIADHRIALSRLGLNGLFGACVGWFARRAARRAQVRAAACHDGACRIDRPD